VNVAMAEIVRPYFIRSFTGPSKDDWGTRLDDQKKAARDLIAAVKKEDGRAVAEAARDIHNACQGCHRLPGRSSR